jgi:hypothetical protein
MALLAVEHVLAWYEEQNSDIEGEVKALAQQMANPSMVSTTDEVRRARFRHRLQAHRIQYLSLGVGRLSFENLPSMPSCGVRTPVLAARAASSSHSCAQCSWPTQLEHGLAPLGFGSPYLRLRLQFGSLR